MLFLMPREWLGIRLWTTRGGFASLHVEKAESRSQQEARTVL
jgi:hypothetical protein